MSEFNIYDRRYTAERIRRSGTRICSLALLICYIIAWHFMLEGFGVHAVVAIAAACVIHVITFLLCFVAYHVCTEIIPSMWDWLKGE